jgi:hypothetical protein
MYSKSLFSVINVLVSNREKPKMYFKKFLLLRFGKTLILIMRVKDASTPGYPILKYFIDKLRSKILTIVKKTFPQIISYIY